MTDERKPNDRIDAADVVIPPAGPIDIEEVWVNGIMLDSEQLEHFKRAGEIILDEEQIDQLEINNGC